MGLTTSKESTPVIDEKPSVTNIVVDINNNLQEKDNKYSEQVLKDNKQRIKELQAEIKNRDTIIANLKHKTYNESDECDDIIKVKKNIEYENLVFEGAGTKGIAYCGALHVLELLGILSKIKRYAGSSAGAIIAMLLAIGYNVEEITKITHDTDFKKFIDDKTGMFRDVYCIMNYYGYCDGAYFLSYVEKLIEAKTGNGNMTFAELLKYNSKELVITGTNITHMNTVYFSHLNHPNMAIKDAVRISMSIPFLFVPVKLNDCYMVDGGVIDNYPIHIFDGKYPGDRDAILNMIEANPKTLGFKIVTPDETENFEAYKPATIGSLKDFGMTILNTMMAANERKFMKPSYWLRTICIQTPNFPLTQFDVTEEQKKDLILRGKTAVENFFAE